jgi:ABC-type lipoprotein release transport system permease subunit
MLIGPAGFAARNLRRRGFHALLAFLGLTLTVASTTLLLLLGQSLATRLNIESYSRATFGINWIFFGYLFLSLIFVVLVGIISVFYLVTSMINQRMRDIAVIKAAGSLPGRLFSYAFTEALVVIFASSLAGTLSALLIYGSWSGSFLRFSPTGTLVIIGVPTVSFLLSYLAARVRLGKVINTSSVGAISSELSTLDRRSLGRPLHIKRFGSAFNLATRTVSRDRQFTKTVIRVSIYVFLTMVVLTGALISWDTSKSYVERAMPHQVLIVGSSPMVSQYAQLAGSFSTTAPIPPLDYLNGSYIINSQLAVTIRGIPGVHQVDTRLMTMSTVTGYVKAHFASGGLLSGESTNPELIPEAFTGSTQALIVGIDPSQTIADWYTSDGFLRNNDPENTIVVGDSLVGGIVQMPLNLSQVGALGQRFNVKSALVDPFNRGQVLYTPLKSLQQTLQTNGYNILLVKVNNDPTASSRVQQVASANGLVVESEEPILAANLAYLNNTWSYLLILPILTLALTSGILLGYLTTNYSKRFNDYVVLKVLGAKAWYTLKLLLWEGWGILAICMVIALPLVFMFSTILLVPDPRIAAGNIVLSTIVSASALSMACVAAAAVYSRRLRLTTVKDLKP